MCSRPGVVLSWTLRLRWESHFPCEGPRDSFLGLCCDRAPHPADPFPAQSLEHCVPWALEGVLVKMSLLRSKQTSWGPGDRWMGQQATSRVLGTGAASGPSKATGEARPGLGGRRRPGWGRQRPLGCGWSCGLARQAPDNLLEASCPICPNARAVGAFPLHQEPQNVEKPSGCGSSKHTGPSAVGKWAAEPWGRVTPGPT